MSFRLSKDASALKDSPVACVYVMQGWGGKSLYKIGCTGNLRQRYQSADARERIVMIFPVADYYTLEQRIHRHFWHRNVNGWETFRLVCRDLKVLHRFWRRNFVNGAKLPPKDQSRG